MPFKVRERPEERLLSAVPQKVQETVVEGRRNVQRALQTFNEAFTLFKSALPPQQMDGSLIGELLRRRNNEVFVRFARTRDGSVYSMSAYFHGRRVFLTLTVGKSAMELFLTDREGNLLERFSQNRGRVSFWSSHR